MWTIWTITVWGGAEIRPSRVDGVEYTRHRRVDGAGRPTFGFRTGPWTGKCIGKRTLFAFHAFLICLSVHILFVVVGAIVVFAVK